MGKGSALRLPGDAKSQLVSYYSTKQLPLLPFEKQLIEAIGCTEDEYRKLALEAIFQGRVRPAAYEHIPDIQAAMAPVVAAGVAASAKAAVTSTLVSLAVGLALTAVSYLLSPKPNAANADRVRQRQLSSRQQGNRFAPTFGFDSQAELADYNDPVPIVFGRYTGTTGGILVAPSLVWSRVFSYGSQQAVKLLFVIGEQGRDGGQVPQGIAQPDLSGIFLGNGALNSVFSTNYAVYWKRNTTTSGYSRIRASNLLYGTRGTAASGDPETFDDIFTCPTAYSDNDYGFSSAHSLTNNAEFGCYAAIPNGTAYRVNWRVVTIPDLDNQEDDPGNTLIFERIKIAGNGGQSNETSKTGVRELGQAGEGRNYSRRMGIVSLRKASTGATITANIPGTSEHDVAVDDVIEFMISNAKIPGSFYSEGKVRVDDINDEIKEQCIAADDALQVGELFMIGRAVWQVTARKLPLWSRSASQDQVITLRCIETPETQSRIGLVAKNVLTSHVLGDSITSTKHVGIAYYPLMRFALAVVSNTRACEVTEIGIRSNVFQRLNSLCNFRSIPTPEELLAAEKNKTNITSGTSNVYIKRASVFTVQVRPEGLDPSGKQYTWAPVNILFAVVGSRPIDIYSFIRFKHPQKGRYEFRLIPKNGADLRLTPDATVIWQLSTKGNGTDLIANNASTAYGTFEVRASGVLTTKYEISSNNELAARADFQQAVKTEPLPSQVGVYAYLPDENADGGRATAIEYRSAYSEPTGFTEGRTHAFAFELFGGAGVSPLALGGTTEVLVTETLPGNRWVAVRYQAKKVLLPAGHYSGRTYSWEFQNFWVENSSKNFTIGTEFVVKRTLSPTNPYRVNPNQGTMTSAGLLLKVTNITGFNPNQGRAQGLYEELFGPARANSVGTTKTLQLDLASTTGKTIRVILESIVERVTGHWSGETRLWAHPVITVVRNSAYTSTTWQVGETATLERTVSPGNPFQPYTAGYTKVGAILQILAITEKEVTAAKFDAERIFEYQSQYADLSYYGNLIEKSNSSSPEHVITYVNEMVSNATIPTYDNMTICGLALKAGRNFTALDQLRIWLSEGLHVRRFHPDDASAPTGPSNLFCDLVFYFLTNQVGGLGPFLGMSGANAPLINTDDLVKTARFLKANALFYDGVIGTARNLRQFIADTAPFFLCNFVISDGRFSLVPALPTTAGGQISTEPVQIKQLFTAGNIFEDSFELEYLDAEERKDFQAVVRYREQARNQLPQERNIVVRWNDSDNYAAVESFDLTEYCTSEAHASLVAKFFLSVRRRITHSVRFTTSPYGLHLAPGDYIKVLTQSSPYNPAKNGTIAADGTITSVQPLENGQYKIMYYVAESEDVETATMTVSAGKTTDQLLWNSVFTVLDSTISQNIYTVEQLTFNEDGTVQISASEFPCDANGASLIAKDIVQDANFIFER